MRKGHFIPYYLFLIVFLSGIFRALSQEVNPSCRLYFLSDCQQPTKVEELRLKPYRNTEARDSLFSDMIRHKPSYLFLLGDQTSAGSDPHSWKPIDDLLNGLLPSHTFIHAIPGNHEYYVHPGRGIQNFHSRFPKDAMTGYCVKTDSMAIVMLNSNFRRLSSQQIKQQQEWYFETMDSLDSETGIKAILVCTHHPPYTNSKIVKPSKQVLLDFVTRFTDSPKSKLFIAGHSHNLEYFSGKRGKKFLVTGGGGGLVQPLQSSNKRLFQDLLPQETKPLYFYLIIERKGNSLSLSVRGLSGDFGSVKTCKIGAID